MSTAVTVVENKIKSEKNLIHHICIKIDESIKTDDELAETFSKKLKAYYDLFENETDKQIKQPGDYYKVIKGTVRINLPYRFVGKKTIAVFMQHLLNTPCIETSLELSAAKVAETSKTENDYIIDFLNRTDFDPDIGVIRLIFPYARNVQLTETLKALGTFIKLNRTLGAVHITGFRIRNEDAAALVSVFQGVQSNSHSALTGLDLTGYQLVMREVQSLTQLLRSNKRLMYLKLANCGLNDEQLEIIILAINNNPDSNIRNLNIAVNLMHMQSAAKTTKALEALLSTSRTLNDILIDNETDKLVHGMAAGRLLRAKYQNPHFDIPSDIYFENSADSHCMSAVADVMGISTRINGLRLINNGFILSELGNICLKINTNPYCILQKLELYIGFDLELLLRNITALDSLLDPLKLLLKTSPTLTKVILSLGCLTNDKQSAEIIQAIQGNCHGVLSKIILRDFWVEELTFTAIAQFLRFSTTTTDFLFFVSHSLDYDSKLTTLVPAIIEGISKNKKTVLRSLSLPYPITSPRTTQHLGQTLLQLLEKTNKTIGDLNGLESFFPNNLQLRIRGYLERNEQIALRLDSYWSILSILIAWYRVNANHAFQHSVFPMLKDIMSFMDRTIPIGKKPTTEICNVKPNAQPVLFDFNRNGASYKPETAASKPTSHDCCVML